MKGLLSEDGQNGWRLDVQTRELECVAGPRYMAIGESGEEFQGYRVDLDRCRSSAEVLDWIFQVASKTWATPEIVAGLIDALDAVLEPQATLCSFGRSRLLKAEDVRRRVESYAS